MMPMVTLLLCLPAALLFIVCVCGIAVLRPPATRLADHVTAGRQRGGRRTV
jgi:hypothetical protein